MSNVSVKQAEAKTIQFTITDENGAAVDVSSATLSLVGKLDKDDAVSIFTKADGVFDKTNAANGVVTVVLTTDDTNRASSDEYVMELTITFSAVRIDKSHDIKLIIQKAVST